MNKHKFYGICLQGKVLEAIKYLEHRERKSTEVNKLIDLYTKRFITCEEKIVSLSDDP